MTQKVSIIIIGRNEARSIARCVRAAQAAAEQIGGAEIIYVDSASTDETPTIVRALGVRAIGLRSTWELSPSAGRYIGTRAAHGEFVLFLDADTILYQDFLFAALAHFAQNPRVAGVAGWLDDANEDGELLDGIERRDQRIVAAKWLRGACCFYRRAALLEVGSFNPFVKVEEEAELGLRLVKRNWRINVLPVSMALHTRSFDSPTFQSLWSAVKRDCASKRLGEILNTIVYAARAGNATALVWLRLPTTVVFAGWLMLTAAAPLLLLLLPPPAAFYAAAICVLAAAAGLVLVVQKKRGLRGALIFAASKTYNIFDVLCGVNRVRIRNVESYPVDYAELLPEQASGARKNCEIKSFADADSSGAVFDLPAPIPK